MPIHHRWSRQDDIVVFYIYRFGIGKLKLTIEQVAEARNIPVGSFKMRLSNFSVLDGRQGLDHFSEQSKEVYDNYKKLDEITLRQLAFPDLKK